MDERLVTNKERMKIFSVFTENKTLTFNKLKKITNLRSNILTYHLKIMQRDGFIKKTGPEYSLTQEAQKLVPYFSQIFKKEVGVLPVVLGIVRHKDSILLLKRKKMPYQGYWGLFGGKQIMGETIPETMEREIFEEARIKAHFINYNAVVYERLKEDEEYKHSFLFIITTLKTDKTKVMEQKEGAVKWFNYKRILAGKEEGIIPTDIEFLKKYGNKKIEIDHMVMEENDGKLILTP